MLMVIHPVYSVKTLTCEDVKNFVRPENLKPRIFDAGEEVFPLQEIAESDKDAAGKENETYWKEKGCCETSEGCARVLGESFAAIFEEVKHDDKKLRILLTFIDNTLNQFFSANFKSACTITYNSFAAKLSDPVKIERVSESWLALSRFSIFREELIKNKMAKQLNEKIDHLGEKFEDRQIADEEQQKNLTEDINKKITTLNYKLFFVFLASLILSFMVCMAFYLYKIRNSFAELREEIRMLPQELDKTLPDSLKLFRIKENIAHLETKIGKLKESVAYQLQYIRTASKPSDIASLKNEMDEIEADLETLEHGLEILPSYQAKVPELRENILNLKTSFQEIRSEFNRLEKAQLKLTADLKGSVPQPPADSAQINGPLSTTENKIEKLQKSVRQIQTGLETCLKQGDLSLVKNLLSQIQGEIKELKQKIGEVEQQIESHSASVKDAVTSAIIETELSLLLDRWDTFKQYNPELVDLASKIRDSEEKDFYLQEVRVNLPKLLARDEELLSQYQEITLPLTEYYPQLLKIEKIHNHLSGIPKEPETKPLSREEAAKELFRLRNWSQLLTSLNAEEARKMLDFEPGKWVRERFVKFADQFLCKYQEAKLANQHQALAEALEIVLAVLAKADLKPAEIELGKTPFDSQKHIARSTTKNPEYRNDVIMRVLRNGFEQTGRGVIQQPEVIVNKTG
jgi:molecular chaperone GrpE (heat shock protein)